MAAGSQARAARLHARAVEQYNLGTPARALRTLGRALHEVGADIDDAAARAGAGAGTSGPDTVRAALVARLWISIALTRSEIGSVEDGVAALGHAERYATIADDPAVSVLLHCQRGLIALRRGDASASVASLDRAVELIEHAEPRDSANILLNRGTVAMMQGRLGSARTDLSRGAAIARSAGLAVEEFKSLHNLAYVEFLAGDLPAALRLMNESPRAGAHGDWGVALLDRARVLTEAGLTREADDALARASVILRRDRMTQDLAETLLERARCALVVGNSAAARRFASQARAGFRRRGNDRWRRMAELVQLSGDLAAGRPGRRLVGPALALRDECVAEGLTFPARSAALLVAEAYLAADDVDQASRTVEALTPPDRRDPITSRVHDHYVRARVAAAQGRVSAASAAIHRAQRQLGEHQASFGSIDLRTAAAVHGRRLAELDLDLALGGGRAALVFSAAERARAIASRLPPVRPPEDPASADLLAELRQVIEALRGVEQDRAASERLLTRRFELERRITARTWSLAGSGGAPRAVDLGAVRERLRERGRVMVMYVQTAQALWAVTVGRRVSLHSLGPLAPVVERVRRCRADLDVLANEHVPAPLRAAVQNSLTGGLAALDAALIAPLRQPDEPLAIISTGVLGQLPWASLASLRGRSLVVAPSASKWLASTEPRAHEGCAVSAVAGPSLVRAEDEADAVGRSWPGARTLTGSAASRAALMRACAEDDLVHVAAHGTHQPQSPLFSALRMADGPLFAHELDLLGTAPEHVVLSACEVGLATVRPGDEALGLASVLLHLGTRCVIAGVARVSDRVAEQVMLAYHAELSRGIDSAQALAGALADVDSDVVAPFVAFGATWAREPVPG